MSHLSIHTIHIHSDWDLASLAESRSSSHTRNRPSSLRLLRLQQRPRQQQQQQRVATTPLEHNEKRDVGQEWNQAWIARRSLQHTQHQKEE